MSLLRTSWLGTAWHFGEDLGTDLLLYSQHEVVEVVEVAGADEVLADDDEVAELD